MFDLNVLAKTLNADSSMTVLLNKVADKFTVTVIPVLKNITDSSDVVVSTLQAVLTQPIRITVPQEADINTYVNEQISALLQARQPAVSQLSQYQQQIQEAQNQATLAEQEAKDKKAKAIADKAEKALADKADKAKKPATTTKASAVDATDTSDESDENISDENPDDGENDSLNDAEATRLENEQAQQEQPPVPAAIVSSQAPNAFDLFSNLGA